MTLLIFFAATTPASSISMHFHVKAPLFPQLVYHVSLHFSYKSIFKFNMEKAPVRGQEPIDEGR